MKAKTPTREFKLYNKYIDIDQRIKPIRLFNRRATIVGDRLYSYDTQVAMIDWESKIIFSKERAFFYSKTTTKHIQEVARKYELKMFGGRPNRVIHKNEYTHSYSL